jgi:hypothetical protein
MPWKRGTLRDGVLGGILIFVLPVLIVLVAGWLLVGEPRHRRHARHGGTPPVAANRRHVNDASS